MEIDLNKLSRKQLQSLAKKHNLKANESSDNLRSALAAGKRKATTDASSSSSSAKMAKGHADEEEEEEVKEKTNPLQKAWDELMSTIAKGVEMSLWTAPTLNPPATKEAIAALETEFKFSIGGYADLLRLADGMSWYSKGVGVVYGGTGDDEDDLPHAFNYSEDYGRKLFRRKKQVPMQMMDYDMCVNVYEVKSGRVMQDDRECESFHHIASSLSAWLQDQAKELNEAITKKQAETQEEEGTA